MDFQDHRSYSPGDDPRHINWNAYARTGQYTMKVFREENRPMVDLIVDASASMTFLPEKAGQSANLISFLVDSSLAAGASVRVHPIGGEITIPHLKAPVTPIPASLQKATLHEQLASIPFRSSSFRVLVSDLLFPDDPIPIFRQLTQRQGIPILFSPFSISEAKPDWSGNYEFIDAETNAHDPRRIEPATLRQYLSAYSNHFKIWKDISTRYRAPFARVPAELPLMKALHTHALSAKAVEII